MEMEVSSSLHIVSVDSVESLPPSPEYIPSDEEDESGRNYITECRSRSLPTSRPTSPYRLRGLSYNSSNEVYKR